MVFILHPAASPLSLSTQPPSSCVQAAKDKAEQEQLEALLAAKEAAQQAHPLFHSSQMLVATALESSASAICDAVPTSIQKPHSSEWFACKVRARAYKTWYYAPPLLLTTYAKSELEPARLGTMPLPYFLLLAA